MKNPFLDLEEEEVEAPPQIKKTVVGNLGVIRFVGDIVDLYLGKTSKVISGFMHTLGPKKD